MEDKKITWSKAAIRQFEAAIDYIAIDSVQNADKVRKDILDKIQTLKLHAEIYSPDKYRINNDGTYRAFELHRYRIAYKVARTGILIFRIRHTSREPKPY